LPRDTLGLRRETLGLGSDAASLRKANGTCSDWNATIPKPSVTIAKAEDDFRSCNVVLQERREVARGPLETLSRGIDALQGALRTQSDSYVRNASISRARSSGTSFARE
jgi:hypothetical protein